MVDSLSLAWVRARFAIAGYIGLVVNALALLPTGSEYNTFGLRVFHVVVISPLMDPCFCSSQRRTVAAKV